MLKTVRSLIPFSSCISLTFATTKKHKKKTSRAAAKKYAGSRRIKGKELLNRNEYVKKERNFRAETWKILILLILFGINGSLVSFVGYVTYQERESLQRESVTEFPVPCEDLSLSADEDFITFDVKKGDLKTFINDAGKYVCSQSNVTETVQTVVEREARYRLAKGLEEQYLSCGKESLADKSGYLTVFFSEISKHQNISGVSSDIKLRWDIHSGNCHIDPSVYYSDGEVIIPEGRTYFVCTQLHTSKSADKEKMESRILEDLEDFPSEFARPCTDMSKHYLEEQYCSIRQKRKTLCQVYASEAIWNCHEMIKFMSVLVTQI